MRYPVTPEALAALARFPELQRRIGSRVREGERSDLEIVRLLGNMHYPHIERLLTFIEDHLLRAGAIGTRLLQQTDPFQLAQSCAELYLLAHLQRPPSISAEAVSPRSGAGRYDIHVAYAGGGARIEVFCPVDVFAAQLLQGSIRSTLKYLDVPRGFELEVALETRTPMNVAWAYDVGSPEAIRRWLVELECRAREWLDQPSPSLTLKILGPGDELSLTIRLKRLYMSAAERCITLSTPTRSTDTRLTFECGRPEDTARSAFGRKLLDKLRRRQCGEPTEGVCRILVLDFALADTGWPDFFMRPAIAERLAATVQILVSDLEGPPPYDLVVPASLGIDCSFGTPIAVGSYARRQAEQVVSALGLDQPFVRPRADQAQHLAELLEEAC